MADGGAHHLGRAEHHKTVGDALAGAANEEWAAVCYFYSAHHLARHALISDPVFRDLTRLRAINADLLPGSRNITRHHGRFRAGEPRQWEINELVQVLYPTVAPRYERLHQASIAVRYKQGIPRFSGTDSRAWLDGIEAERAAGRMSR